MAITADGRGADPDGPLPRARLPHGEGGGRDERAQLAGVHPGAVEGVRRRAARRVVGLGLAVASGLLRGHGAECTDGPWPFLVGPRGRSRQVAAGSQGDREQPLHYHGAVQPPATGDWIAVTEAPLPVDAATAWATTPGSGAVVVFLGVVRDNSDGRDGVRGLSYEAYEEEAVAKLAAVADDARRRWPVVDRVALAAPHRRPRAVGGVGRGGRVVTAPARGIRGGPVLHRHAQGDGADLEA